MGAVIFKHDAGVAGQRLQISGVLKPHWDGNVSAPVPAPARAHVGGAIPLFDTHLTLDGPGAVNFSLAALPASVFMNLVITITLPNTGGTITRWKLFQRAPPPPTVHVPSRPMSPPWGVNPISSGSPHVRPMGVHRTWGERVVPDRLTKSRQTPTRKLLPITARVRVQGSNVTVFQVDHETKGMLANGWLPFVALGWFNSPFEYAHESEGDMSLASKGVSPYVARGGSVSTEWARRRSRSIPPRLGSFRFHLALCTC